VTGQATASSVPVEVHVIMDADSLLGEGTDPSTVDGYGPVPGPLARSWVCDPGTPVWLRRFFTAPHSGQLAAMDSTRRSFAGNLRRFIGVRDGVCRTPWCDAPIRHVDHAARVADGGGTSVLNGQGLCEACNLAKDAVGWRARADGEGTVETTTPTSHGYAGPVPPSPVARGPSRCSRLDISFRDLVLSA
jgi:hypothetical protein